MAPIPPTRQSQPWVGDRLLQHCADALRNLNTPSTPTSATPMSRAQQHNRKSTRAARRAAARVIKPRNPAPNPRRLATPLPTSRSRSSPNPTNPTQNGSGGRTRRRNMATSTIARAMAIDEFLAQEFPDGPPAPKKSKKNNAQQAAPGAAAASTPVPTTTATRSSESTIRLHELAQGFGLTLPRFSYSGDAQGWRGSVVLPGLGDSGEDIKLDLEENEMCGTKQQVKEKLSGRAVTVIEALEADGKVGKKKKGARGSNGAASTTNTTPDSPKDVKEPFVNYVGLLLEYQRSIAGPQPTYTEHTLGNKYACEAHLPGHPTPFGSLSDLHSTKKAARQAAAQAVIKYLEASGALPADSGGSIKKKPKAQPPTPNAFRTPPTTAPAPGDDDGPTAASFAQQVVLLATQLGLQSPVWYFEASSAPGFCSVSCAFPGAGPLEGPWGEVRNVFGKKRAKEECARLVVEVLRKEKERRVEGLRGLVGGAGVKHEDEDEDEFHDAE